MAVYTEVSSTQLAAYLEAFDLGKVLSLKGITGGVENTNYALHTQTGSYILTLYEKRVAEEDLPFFVGLMDHLAQAGFPCPLPIRNRAGDALGHLAQRPAAMVSFLEGMEISDPAPRHGSAVGATMARMHLLAEDFQIKRTNALAPHGWPELANASADEADSVEAGLRKLIADEMIWTAKHWPKDIPTGVIHADMFKDNVFFLDDQLSGVIDFYFACNDFLAYDIAVAINAWCFNADLKFQPDMCAAILQGYQTVRPLETTEKQALPVLARGAALRFLLTRLNDWLNVPEGAVVVPHDPKAFSARLRCFQEAETAEFLKGA